MDVTWRFALVEGDCEMAAGTDSGLTSIRDEPWVASIILGFDRLLQRWHGVFEYSTDPLCVFRIQPDMSDRNIVLGDGTSVSVGDRILNLHLWSEHVPPMALTGPTIGWARRYAHGLEYSLQLLSEYLSGQPQYSGVVAIRATLMVASRRNIGQMVRIVRHCGFESLPGDERHSWAGRIHQFADNVLGLLLCVAVSPRSARGEVLRRVRSQVMLSRHLLDQRYTEQQSPSATNSA